MGAHCAALDVVIFAEYLFCNVLCVYMHSFNSDNNYMCDFLFLTIQLIRFYISAKATLVNESTRLGFKIWRLFPLEDYFGHSVLSHVHIVLDLTIVQ